MNRFKSFFELKWQLFYIGILAFLGIGLTIIENRFTQGVGLSLIAAATVTLLEFIKSKIDIQFSKRTRNVLEEGGIEWIYSNRDITGEYEKIVKSIKSELFITGYSLSGFYESHKDAIKEISKKRPDVKFNILFVNPDSEISQKKEEIEEKARGTYKTSYKTFLHYFKDCKNVEIRLIDYPLSSMIFKVDDTVYVGPQFCERSSKMSFTMKLNKGKWVYDQFVSELHYMWENSESACKDD